MSRSTGQGSTGPEWSRRAVGASNGGQPPDAVYAGIMTDPRSPLLFQTKVAVLGDNSKVKMIGPDAIQTQSLLDSAGMSVTAGIYATVGGLPLNQLPPAGQKFVQDYTAQYGAPQSAFAVDGYEAMSAALQAIENVCATGGHPTDRRAVRDAVFGLKDFNGALGTWSLDANGDTTLTDMVIYVAKGDSYQPFAVSRANAIAALP